MNEQNPVDPVDPDDLAPDANDPGDALPDELKDLLHNSDEPIVPDNVDQEEVEDDE